MDFSPSPDSDDNSGYYRNRNRRDDRDRGNRGRSKERYRSNSHYSRSRSRSYSKERYLPRQRSPGERDLYRDIVDQDYAENNWERDRYRHRSRERDRDRDRRSRDRDRNRDRRDKSGKRGYSPNSMDEGETYETDNESFYQQKPNNKIIIRGLAPQITEADINSDLIQSGLQAIRVRLIRKKKTGESRGFAFVEFRTEEEATRWICYKQGVLVVNGHHAVMQYTFSVPSECRSKDKSATDWYCAKCCAFNFKRRENCFKCYASREESEIGGEGSDEMSNILTKKIMFRNLDVLTNEESVLCVMQETIPDMVSKIAKILICRDPLTSISRGICYLHFDNLVDSMNTHNALKALATPLKIDNREVLISYCMDTENRNLVKHPNKGNSNSNSGNHGSNNQNSGHGNSHGHNSSHHGYQEPPAPGGNAGAAFNNAYQQYTVADVPRLAEYSASVYASNPAEHEHYLQYYKNYYMTQITQGQTGNLPPVGQLGETANNGAAVAQSAIARKQSGKARQDTPMAGVIGPANQPPQSSNRIPNGVDGRKYPTPDVSVYQYDETSGFYYDPSTGLYYDSHSQYYYNNETSSYLYWDPENSTYVSAPSAAASSASAAVPTFAISATSHEAVAAATALANACDTAPGNDNKAEKPKAKEQSQDKVKVAKKIVKDMEKWAKQLNQKKDYSVIQPSAKVEEATLFSSLGPSKVIMEPAAGYADVGFSLLEKKERTQAISSYLMSQASKPSSAAGVPSASAAAPPSVAAPPPSYGSDSDNEANDDGGLRERDLVDFDKLTCLLCKRAFQSHEILNKHLKMSSLHKENLQKLNMQRGSGGTSSDGGNLNNIPYRDRAKERRQKYGEDEAPPVNRSKERFQRELEKQQQSSYQQTSSVSVPIGQNNVGNKLLQKMGWSEGQGLGRANQGRVNIIEAESRVANVGLGIKAPAAPYGRTADDYKTYIKKMMKSRYEQVDVKD